MLKKTVLLGILFITSIAMGHKVNSVGRYPQKCVYIFSADWCKYCKILKKDILKDTKIVDRLSNIKVIYINKDNVSKRILDIWGIKYIPTIVVVNRIDGKSVKILEKWQLQNILTDKPRYEQNKRSFLKLVDKYFKKTQKSILIE